MSYVVLWIAGFVAAVLFFINSAMFPRLLYIRKGNNRILKRKLALLLRKEMKWHAALGWVGLGFVFIHIGVQIQSFSYLFWDYKRILGVIAFLSLIFVLWSGWLRSQKANGLRRRFHAWNSIFFTLIVLLHLIW